MGPRNGDYHNRHATRARVPRRTIKLQRVPELAVSRPGGDVVLGGGIGRLHRAGTLTSLVEQRDAGGRGERSAAAIAEAYIRDFVFLERRAREEGETA